jgi:hypothetical protein
LGPPNRGKGARWVGHHPWETVAIIGITAGAIATGGAAAGLAAPEFLGTVASLGSTAAAIHSSIEAGKLGIDVLSEGVTYVIDDRGGEKGGGSTGGGSGAVVTGATGGVTGGGSGGK